MTWALVPCSVGAQETGLTEGYPRAWRDCWGWVLTTAASTICALRKAWWSRGCVSFPSCLPQSCVHSEPSPEAVPREGGRELLKRNSWHVRTSSGDSSVHPLIGSSARPSIHWSTYSPTHSSIHLSAHPSSQHPYPRHTCRFGGIRDTQRTKTQTLLSRSLWSNRETEVN